MARFSDLPAGCGGRMGEAGVGTSYWNPCIVILGRSEPGSGACLGRGGNEFEQVQVVITQRHPSVDRKTDQAEKITLLQLQ